MTQRHLIVTGHRPDKLPGGYNDMHPARIALNRRIGDAIDYLNPNLAYIGMALGVDMVAANACLALGIPYVACVPCDGQDSCWPEPSRQRYADLCARAARVENVSPGPYAAWKMLRRDEYMVARAAEGPAGGVCLAVWGGTPSGTGRTLNWAQGLEMPVLRIDPRDLSMTYRTNYERNRR